MLGAAGQGQLALFTQFALLTSMAMSFGLPPALVHFVASGKIPKDQVMSLLLTVTLVGFVLLLPALLFVHAIHFFFPILPDFMASGLPWACFVILYLLLLVGNGFFTALLQAEHRFIRAGSLQVISSLFLLAAYGWRFFNAPVSLHETLVWIVLAMGVSQGILWLGQLASIVKQYPAYIHLHFASLKVLNPMLNFAFLAYSTNLIQFLSYKMDTWLVNYFHGNQPTGIYALAVSLSQMIWLLPAAVQSVLFSFLSTHFDRSLDRRKTLVTTRQLGAYAVVAAFTGYILSMYVVPAWFGGAFTPAVNLIGILLLGMAPFCLTMPISAYFASRGRLQTNLVSAVIGFVVCLAADLLLIPSHGMIGAAWASVLSYLSTLAFFLWMFFRKGEPR